jgi:hypothetical protein
MTLPTCPFRPVLMDTITWPSGPVPRDISIADTLTWPSGPVPRDISIAPVDTALADTHVARSLRSEAA